MIGISIRANWDFEKIINLIVNLNIDFCEIQLDNPIFKFQELQAKAIKLIDKLYSKDLQLAFHLSFIDLNLASLDHKIRSYSSKLLKKEIEFIKEDYPKKGKKLVIKPKMEDKVGLLKITINMFPEQFEFYKNYKGLVIEGTGLGHTPGQAPNEYCKIHKKTSTASCFNHYWYCCNRYSCF